MAFDQITLPNGLRIIGERIPHFRSVSVGLWLGAGSQFETVEEAVVREVEKETGVRLGIDRLGFVH